MPRTRSLSDEGKIARPGRNAALDLLRVVSALAVVCIHVAAQVNVATTDIYSSAWWAGNVAEALSRWSVPVFVMISGALLLAKPSETAPVEFYRKKAARVLAPLIFWTLFYIAFIAVVGEPIGLAATLKSVLSGSPYYHLWFIYMLIGLYAITPFLRPIVVACSAASLRLLILGCLFIAYADSLVMVFYGRAPEMFLTRFIPYIGYFLAGHYLYTRNTKPALGALLASLITAMALIALGKALLQEPLGDQARLMMYSYFNPLVMVSAASIFVLFVGYLHPYATESSVWVSKLAPITLGIYLVHPFWLHILSDMGLNGLLVHPIVGIPLTTLAAFAVSALSAALLGMIPMVKVIVK